MLSPKSCFAMRLIACKLSGWEREREKNILVNIYSMVRTLQLIFSADDHLQVCLGWLLYYDDRWKGWFPANLNKMVSGCKKLFQLTETRKFARCWKAFRPPDCWTLNGMGWLRWKYLKIKWYFLTTLRLLVASGQWFVIYRGSFLGEI